MKNPRILVVPSDPSYGTDWYRTTGVFNKLPVEIVKPDGGQFSWTTLAGVDIVYFQRPATQFEVHCLETAKKYKKPILLDYDDDPTSLNEDNPVYEFWNRDDKQACIKHCLGLADIIMTSTQALKEALLEIAPGVDIRVVPNAQDDALFSLEPFHGERRKIIALRGGSSHKNDWLEFKDGILQILKSYPEYKLAVMGYHPEWLREVPDNQIEYHQFKDLPTYFENLMQLRPEIALVPLSDNKFNRAKSNIGWQEFTLAGAAVIASDLPEFTKNQGCWTVVDNHDLVGAFHELQDRTIREACYRQSLREVPVLSLVNEVRRDIIDELLTSTKKYAPNAPEKRLATDLEFFEHSLTHGHTQDDKNYQELMSGVADWIIKTLNPKTTLELGAGTGGTLVELLKRGVMAYGLEINPYSIQYFKDNHPMYENQLVSFDFTKERLEFDAVGDLVVSFEVFEHINMPEEWWVDFLSHLSANFKYFYFSSTPYHETEAWDHYWGHINLKRTSSWINLFEKSGWKFVSNPKTLVNWDALFASSLA